MALQMQATVVRLKSSANFQQLQNISEGGSAAYLNAQQRLSSDCLCT